MKRRDKYNVAVLGATGAVGRAMLATLEILDFPVQQIRLLASPRSAGQSMSFRDEQVNVEAVSETSFDDIDIALFSAGAGTSLVWAPIAAARGAVVIDNSSAYRMATDVPLVVPEVNPEAVDTHQGIIANPNCSTIQLVVALNALKGYGLEHVSISTYQAVSGMGQQAVDALRQEVQAAELGFTTIFPTAAQTQRYPMAYNVLPQCDVFLDNGYTKEEMKLVNESRKILGMQDLRVSPTAVRVPVLYGHAESVSIRFREIVTAAEVRSVLQSAPGVMIVDDPAESVFPHPQMATGSGHTYIGRIRQDLSDARTVLMFIVADNLLKGAAYNAVQIAQTLAARAAMD